jgi:hypothetical protein
VLQRIYLTATRLVVCGICKRYAEKPWTQDEWRAIQVFERRLRPGDAGGSPADRNRFLPLRFGDGEVDGVFETAIVPDGRDRSAEQIAALILERLQLASGSASRTRGTSVRTTALSLPWTVIKSATAAVPATRYALALAALPPQDSGQRDGLLPE